MALSQRLSEISLIPIIFGSLIKIENTSERVIQVENDIDIEILDGVQTKNHEPGKSVWKWSQTYGERKNSTASVGPGGVYQEKICIDKKEADVSRQYYINAYYKGELVAQYKIIEGIYK